MCTLILKSVNEFIADSIIKIEQGISDILYEMEWAPVENLFWNANDSIVKLVILVINGVPFWDRLCYENSLNYDIIIKCLKLATI